MDAQSGAIRRAREKFPSEILSRTPPTPTSSGTCTLLWSGSHHWSWRMSQLWAWICFPLPGVKSQHFPPTDTSCLAVSLCLCHLCIPSLRLTRMCMGALLGEHRCGTQMGLVDMVVWMPRAGTRARTTGGQQQAQGTATSTLGHMQMRRCMGFIGFTRFCGALLRRHLARIETPIAIFHFSAFLGTICGQTFSAALGLQLWTFTWGTVVPCGLGLRDFTGTLVIRKIDFSNVGPQ